MRNHEKDLEICNKATPAPWEAMSLGVELNYPNHISQIIDLDIGVRDVPDAEVFLANAKFIATAREALPWYIDRCMELEKKAK